MLLHPRKYREHRCLGLAAGRRSEQQRVPTSDDGGNGFLLQRPKTRPAKGIDDVMLDRRVEGLKSAHRLQLDVVGRCRGAFGIGEFAARDRQRVVAPRIEVGV